LPPPLSKICSLGGLLAALACAALCRAQVSISCFTLSAEERGRAEFIRGLGFTPGRDNDYYLHRLRLNLSLDPVPWLRFYFQGQDSRAPSYRMPVPDNVANTFDLRQGYVELGRTDKGPWDLRLGRQELIFGEERLVGASNWGNVGRAFDGARLTWRRPRARLDWFATTLVVPLNGHFDRPRLNDARLYGMYGAFENWLPKSVVEPFFLIKTDNRTHISVYTGGARLNGKLPRRLDYDLELALQSGRAGAVHGRLGYTLSKDPLSPRLLAEYNYATGHGRYGTFDQLYPTNHNKYGTADVIAWRNIHDLMAGSEWKPLRHWKLNLDYHSFWLATRNDALYTEAGAAFVRNPAASSSHVGDEVDFQALWRATTKLQLGFGVGHLFPGRFLKDSTPGAGYTYPYILWSYTL
jgi:hypothetical protein